MIEGETRKVITILGIGLFVVLCAVIFLRKDSGGVYYTADDGSRYFTDKNQTAEESLNNYYSILGSASLAKRVGQEKYEYVRSAVESYMLQLDDRPQTVNYQPDSLRFESNDLASFKITTLNPRYEFTVLFSPSTANNHVSVE